MEYTISYPTSGPVSTEMGDRIWASIPPRYVNSALHPSGSLNQVLARMVQGRVAGNTVLSHIACEFRQQCGGSTTVTLRLLTTIYLGGSVAEWLACWTQAQKDLGSNRSRDAVA